MLDVFVADYIKAWMVACAGRIDQDLAVPQFHRNLGTYNIINMINISSKTI
jgi:hypothetical protein